MLPDHNRHELVSFVPFCPKLGQVGTRSPLKTKGLALVLLVPSCPTCFLFSNITRPTGTISYPSGTDETRYYLRHKLAGKMRLRWIDSSPDDLKHTNSAPRLITRSDFAETLPATARVARVLLPGRNSPINLFSPRNTLAVNFYSYLLSWSAATVDQNFSAV